MRDRLLKVILILTALTVLTTWLPLIRGLMDGPTYEWGQSLFGVNFGGKGLGGDYWMLVLQAVIVIPLIYLGWRGARSPFHWLLLLWNVPSVVNAFYNAFAFPEDYRFKGDTLGVDVSVAWVAPLFWGVLTLLSIVWIVRDLKQPRERAPVAWTRKNTVLLTLVLLLLPVQFGLLRFGEPLSRNDQVGVVLTMIQWLLLNLSFVNWRSKQSASIKAYA
jgi:hypothetical protein